MTKWTTNDIPDQTGRTAVITGANTGLGYETAAALAAKGAHVVLAVRNLDKGKDAATLITQRIPGASVALQELDLTSLESIHNAADHLRSRHDHIDLLVNNAGVMMTPKATTQDGFELQFGTNHLGHFAFTGLLLDRLLAIPGSRVVTVSSVGHRIGGGIQFGDLQSERSYGRVRAYGQSKLANLLFTYELQRRLLGNSTIAVAAHPGSSKSELSRNVPVRCASPSDRWSSRAPTWVRCRHCAPLPTPACSAGSTTDRTALSKCGYPKVVSSSDRSHDVDVQKRLWTVSEELTGVVYPLALTAV
jgi:NAD(P)-dependent dehydrogenase (short-subunit alcohol dehydrogenase family)